MDCILKSAIINLHFSELEFVWFRFFLELDLKNELIKSNIAFDEVIINFKWRESYPIGDTTMMWGLVPY